VDVVVRHGSPARAVVEVAVERDVDLVVLGRRGAGGFRGLLMGSVSRRVVERAGRVVLVVH
jgi:nucleotide-binding universal stress UspA family protein